MDARLRYGIGVTTLGLGNLVVGLTQLLAGDQPTTTIALEVFVGFLLVAFGGAVVTDPDRIDTDQLSPRVLTAVGWIGTLLGGVLLAWAALVVVEAL